MGCIIKSEDFESEDQNVTRKKPFLYKKLVAEKTIKIKEEWLQAAKVLLKEKMLTITGPYATINPYCEETDYHKQKIKNERRYKTIVSMNKVIDDGTYKILWRLFLPFHQSIPYAKRLFFAAYKGPEEDENHFITIHYTDAVERKSETIYENVRY